MSLGDRLRARAAANAATAPSAEMQRATAIMHPQNKLAFRRAMVTPQDAKYAEYQEVKRITSMPVIPRMTPAEIDAYTKSHVLASAYDSGFRLFAEQAEGAAAYEMAAGFLGPIGVGRGKTLLSLLIATLAYTKGLHRIMLTVPPNVFEQLTMTDIKAARTKIPMPYSIYSMSGKSSENRALLAKSNKRGLYIFTHSLLSQKDASELVFAVAPQLIIIDEAHHFAKDTAARTKRLFGPTGYIEQHKPEIVALSGTMTKKTVNDYWHLAHAALGENNPLPNSKGLAFEWGSVIDADGGAGGAGGPLLPLIVWARDKFPSEVKQLAGDDQAAFRRAYNLRLTTTPGVVSSSDTEIGTALTLANVPVPDHEKHPDWPRLDELITAVEDEWTTPNGDEIDHAIHTWKWLYELSAGFYNQLVWPQPAVLAKRKSITEADAEVVIAGSMHYHAAGQDYAKMLRKWLDGSARAGLDTPFLVGSDMVRNGDKNVGADLYATWQYWKSTDFEDRIDRDSHAIRVCSYKVDFAVEWAKQLDKDEGALLWVYHQEVGEWLHEKLVAAGIDALHCPAGPKHNTSILDPANARKKIVASMTSHGTGKNLQHFSQQYFVQWPRPASDAEQTIGRTHRTGQKADELVVWRNDTTFFDQLNFAACLNDALYTHQTMGSRQKIVYCNYDPIPKIFPSSVLRQRGFDATVLTRAELQLVKERFGEQAA